MRDGEDDGIYMEIPGTSTGTASVSGATLRCSVSTRAGLGYARDHETGQRGGRLAGDSGLGCLALCYAKAKLGVCDSSAPLSAVVTSIIGPEKRLLQRRRTVSRCALASHRQSSIPKASSSLTASARGKWRVGVDLPKMCRADLRERYWGMACLAGFC